MAMATCKRAIGLAGLLALAAALLSACGNTTAATTSGSKVLRTALTADPSPLDPDTYYEAEGLAITTSTYDGLVTYAPDSPKIVPALATKWTESSDGLTYTFTLRSGVQFSDGTPFDAAAAKASFQRRIDLKGGPSYMLAEVASMTVRGSDTFVVRLKHPVAPFMDFLASPYGPLMTSPTAVTAHTVGNDHASKWFGSHSAGTGPYVLSTVRRGSLYELTANPHYWGTKPYFTTVDFKVVPSLATQRLELQGGQQDLILQRLPQRDLLALAKDPKVQVKGFDALYKSGVWVNPTSKVFGGQPARAALRADLDNVKLTTALYGAYGTPSTQVYPAGMLPDGAAPDQPQVDPSKLAAAMKPFKGQKVTIGYYDASDQMKVLASQLQTQLQALGLQASTRDYPPSILFGLPTDPSQRPDLMTTGFNPDAVAPDTFARIYWYKDAPVNLLGCTSPAADRLLDQAAEQATAETAVKLNAAAAEAYKNSNCWLNVADGKDVIVARAGITGFEHELPWVLNTRLGALKEG
jgi:peptide/nickel transport system substrate-binding protein